MSGARRKAPEPWPTAPQQVTASEPPELLPPPAGYVRLNVVDFRSGKVISVIVPDPTKQYLRKLCG
jgi:hypothetical protein